jgi:hypothetical protein
LAKLIPGEEISGSKCTTRGTATTDQTKIDSAGEGPPQKKFLTIAPKSLANVQADTGGDANYETRASWVWTGRGSWFAAAHALRGKDMTSARRVALEDGAQHAVQLQLAAGV